MGIAAGAAALIVIIALATAALAGLFSHHGPPRALTVPAKIGGYARRPALERQMDVTRLRRQMIAKSAGQASHVVSAVYEKNAPGNAAPAMILFVGGRLTGTSPQAFVTSFTDQFKGARHVAAGPLGGKAACANVSPQASVQGSLALCAWADSDTFGVVYSPTMRAKALGPQMRVVRAGVEHTAR